MAHNAGAGNDDADDRRVMIVGALRVALMFGGLVEAAAFAARLDGLATRALAAAKFSDDAVRPLLEEARRYLEPRPELPTGAPEVDAAAAAGRAAALAWNAEHGVPLRLRWQLARLLTDAANDRTRASELRRAAAYGRRALVLCEQADPVEHGRPSLLMKAVAKAPLEVEDIGLDPVRVEVTPAHELADVLALGRGHGVRGSEATEREVRVSVVEGVVHIDGEPLRIDQGHGAKACRASTAGGQWVIAVARGAEPESLSTGVRKKLDAGLDAFGLRAETRTAGAVLVDRIGNRVVRVALSPAS